MVDPHLEKGMCLKDEVAGPAKKEKMVVDFSGPSKMEVGKHYGST